jgi:hypothetical protein
MSLFGDFLKPPPPLEFTEEERKALSLFDRIQLIPDWQGSVTFALQFREWQPSLYPLSFRVNSRRAPTFSALVTRREGPAAPRSCGAIRGR